MAQFDRMPKELYYLGVAEAVSKRSTCLNKQWGAVIVKDDSIVSTGYNGAPRGLPNCCDIGSCYRIENNIQRGTRYETCLTKDTLLLIPNGRKISIQQLIKYQKQWKPPIYGMNPITKKVHHMPYTISQTKLVDTLLEITFETGGKIKCTPEHRFLMEDQNTYKQACELTTTDHIAGMRWMYDVYAAGNEKIYTQPYSISFIREVKLPYPEPVYDLTVPEYENFAVCIDPEDAHFGVFVHNCSSLHAEQNAIIAASRSDMLHATMYVYGYDVQAGTLVENPNSCILCKRMIINARINEVIFADTNGILKHRHPMQEYGYRIVNVSDWIKEYDANKIGY